MAIPPEYAEGVTGGTDAVIPVVVAHPVVPDVSFTGYDPINQIVCPRQSRTSPAVAVGWSGVVTRICVPISAAAIIKRHLAPRHKALKPARLIPVPYQNTTSGRATAVVPLVIRNPAEHSRRPLIGPEVRNPGLGEPPGVDAFAHDDLAVRGHATGPGQDPAGGREAIVVHQHILETAHAALLGPVKRLVAIACRAVAYDDGALR